MELRLTSDNSALASIARDLRVDVIDMLSAARSGHTAGPLGMAEILAVLYFGAMRHDPAEPEWAGRDVLFLSNGHTAPILYAAMSRAGYFPPEELATLRRFGSRLQGHPERRALPGVESTSGPLGSGLSQAAGFAYALQYLDRDPARTVYTIMGDGELQEGNVWEAFMFAGAYRLGKLIAIVDRNYIQIDGSTEDVLNLGDVAEKARTFDWHTLDVNGHDPAALLEAINLGKARVSQPTLIVAHTVPGRGVPFMEYDHRWHGRPPTPPEATSAVAALRGKESR